MTMATDQSATVTRGWPPSYLRHFGQTLLMPPSQQQGNESKKTTTAKLASRADTKVARIAGSWAENT